MRWSRLWNHTYMLPALDTSKQFRSIKELEVLVKAISLAPLTESEPDWLEWKREAVLDDRRWQAQIAKCIAGFANRDPIVAKLWAGGCSYLVIGAEPGNVTGVTPIDNARLQDGIARFVRQAVRWSPQYIQHEGKHVLVITVEPPEYGDQIVSMLTAYQPNERGTSVCRRGDVFIRRQGRTDIADQDDYDMLVRRNASGPERASGISVEVANAVTAVSFACSSDDIATWCQRLESALLAPLRSRKQEGISAALSLSLDSRSPDDYRREVASYLAKMAPLVPSLARAMAVEDSAPNMQLLVINETEHNFTGVRVELAIEGDVWAFRSAKDALPDLPKRPRKWGSRLELSMPTFPEIQTPNLYGPDIDNSGSTSIEFHDVDLRPSDREELDPIYLVCDAELAGATLTANWTATSSSASGVARGEFPIKVSSEVISLCI